MTNRMMRRKNQALSLDATRAVFQNGSDGVLALHGDDGYPYAVPLNFVLIENSLYFHSAAEGHKVDALKRDPKASFCVVEKNTVVPKLLATAYKSAVAFGTIRILSEEAEKRTALKALAEKYSSAFPAEAEKEIAHYLGQVFVFALDIETMTGKEAKSDVMNAAL